MFLIKDDKFIFKTKKIFIWAFLSGLAAGIIMALFDIILTGLNFVKHSYYDWAFALISGNTANSWAEIIIGQLSHLVFAASLGVLFIYLIKSFKTENLIFKGWFFGIFIWFGVHVIVNLFDFQPLRHIPLSQIISDFFTASVFGIVLSWVVKKICKIS